jgi:hypothetical protein
MQNPTALKPLSSELIGPAANIRLNTRALKPSSSACSLPAPVQYATIINAWPNLHTDSVVWHGPHSAARDGRHLGLSSSEHVNQASRHRRSRDETGNR